MFRDRIHWNRFHLDAPPTSNQSVLGRYLTKVFSRTNQHPLQEAVHNVFFGKPTQRGFFLRTYFLRDGFVLINEAYCPFGDQQQVTPENLAGFKDILTEHQPVTAYNRQSELSDRLSLDKNIGERVNYSPLLQDDYQFFVGMVVPPI